MSRNILFFLMAVGLAAILFQTAWAQNEIKPASPPQAKQSIEPQMSQDMNMMGMHRGTMPCRLEKASDHDQGEYCPFAGKRGAWQRPCHFLKRLPFPLFLLPILVIVKLIALCAVLCTLLHILLTILVFRDMKKRGEVNGLWIPIVLIAGILAVIAYAVWRKTEAKA